VIPTLATTIDAEFGVTGGGIVRPVMLGLAVTFGAWCIGQLWARLEPEAYGHPYSLDRAEWDPGYATAPWQNDITAPHVHTEQRRAS
jgi:hypothetical protein